MSGNNRTGCPTCECSLHLENDETFTVNEKVAIKRMLSGGQTPVDVERTIRGIQFQHHSGAIEILDNTMFPDCIVGKIVKLSKTYFDLRGQKLYAVGDVIVVAERHVKVAADQRHGIIQCFNHVIGTLPEQ